jgi:hypothetical protein
VLKCDITELHRNLSGIARIDRAMIHKQVASVDELSSHRLLWVLERKAIFIVSRMNAIQMVNLVAVNHLTPHVGTIALHLDNVAL